MNEMSIEELKEAVTYSDMDTEAKAEVFEILSYNSIQGENA